MAKISKGAKGGGGEIKVLGNFKLNFKLSLDTLELQMKSKKKVFGIFISNFETYTRYCWVADEEQNKKGLRCVKGVIAFLSHLKRAIW